MPERAENSSSRFAMGSRRVSSEETSRLRRGEAAAVVPISLPGWRLRLLVGTR